MTRGRLEAFSDGVLAVAITLLVLDLHASADDPTTLGHQLVHEWPSFLAYFVSFVLIGLIWLNHHSLFDLVAVVDRRTLVYNLVLLLFVTTIPFTTATVAAFAREGGSSARIAVLLYGGSMEGMGITFTLILRHLIDADLLPRKLTRAERRKVLRRWGVGALVFPIVTAVGLIYPAAMMVLVLAQSLYYLLDQTPIVEPATAEATAPDD